MIILGIDPGTRHLGYGLVDFDYYNIKYIDHGVITPPDLTKDKAYRLGYIFVELLKIIDKYKPDILSVEKAFYAKNVNVAISLGEARGVVFAAAGNRKIKIFEYTPREVKQSIVGKGNATKEQVKFMVKSMLGLREDKYLLDASDALALAISHANNIYVRGHLK